jgi:hypothetical protein
LIDISLTISTVRNAQGKVIGASKIARDITEHKRSEAQIINLAREAGAFEWAAHEPEALQVGVPAEVISSIKFRKLTAAMEAQFGTVVQLICLSSDPSARRRMMLLFRCSEFLHQPAVAGSSSAAALRNGDHSDRADARFARPNIQIYDAHVVDLYQ